VIESSAAAQKLGLREAEQKDLSGLAVHIFCSLVFLCSKHTIIALDNLPSEAAGSIYLSRRSMYFQLEHEHWRKI
jgi:hypothetical protein